MNVENELISVSLEIVAFFFVTVDLYGKERLDRLTVLLLSVMESISKKIQRLVERLIGGVIKKKEEIVRKFGFEPEPETHPLLGMVVTATVSIPLLSWILLSLFDTIRNPSSYPTGFFGFVLKAFTIVGLFLGGLGLIVETVNGLLLLLLGVMLVGLWLIRRMKFEGVLLSIGAILFVIAKGMVWWNAFCKLIYGGS